MNGAHACAFVVIGLAMEAIPAAFPSLFPPTRGDQDNARALWLGFMGTCQASLGLGYWLRFELIPMTRALLARRAEPGAWVFSAGRPAPAR